MVKIVKGKVTDQWLPKHWRKCTFPILKQPAKTSNDVIGSAFLIFYKNIPYMITAKHVLETKEPVIVFARKDATAIGVKFSAFEEIGLTWINHPANFDIAAIPFHLPLSLIRELDIFAIKEYDWVNPIKLKNGNQVAHLGYPEKGTSIYSDGSPSPFPMGMPGNILEINPPYIITKTAGAPGASGGPLFLKQEKSAFLIGIVLTVKMYGKPTRPNEAVNLEKTTSIMISLIKDILELREMKEQYENRYVDETWIY